MPTKSKPPGCVVCGDPLEAKGGASKVVSKNGNAILGATRVKVCQKDDCFERVMIGLSGGVEDDFSSSSSTSEDDSVKKILEKNLPEFKKAWKKIFPSDMAAFDAAPFACVQSEVDIKDGKADHGKFLRRTMPLDGWDMFWALGDALEEEPILGCATMARAFRYVRSLPEEDQKMLYPDWKSMDNDALQINVKLDCLQSINEGWTGHELLVAAALAYGTNINLYHKGKLLLLDLNQAKVTYLMVEDGRFSSLRPTTESKDIMPAEEWSKSYQRFFKGDKWLIRTFQKKVTPESLKDVLKPYKIPKVSPKGFRLLMKTWNVDAGVPCSEDDPALPDYDCLKLAWEEHASQKNKGMAQSLKKSVEKSVKTTVKECPAKEDEACGKVFDSLIAPCSVLFANDQIDAGRREIVVVCVQELESCVGKDALKKNTLAYREESKKFLYWKHVLAKHFMQQKNWAMLGASRFGSVGLFVLASPAIKTEVTLEAPVEVQFRQLDACKAAVYFRVKVGKEFAFNVASTHMAAHGSIDYLAKPKKKKTTSVTKFVMGNQDVIYPAPAEDSTTLLQDKFCKARLTHFEKICKKMEEKGHFDDTTLIAGDMNPRLTFTKETLKELMGEGESTLKQMEGGEEKLANFFDRKNIATIKAFRDVHDEFMAARKLFGKEVPKKGELGFLFNQFKELGTADYPTFRCNTSTGEFGYRKGQDWRFPAWCDRVLARIGVGAALVPDKGSVHAEDNHWCAGSDHKPMTLSCVFIENKNKGAAKPKNDSEKSEEGAEAGGKGSSLRKSTEALASSASKTIKKHCKKGDKSEEEDESDGDEDDKEKSSSSSILKKSTDAAKSMVSTATKSIKKHCKEGGEKGDKSEEEDENDNSEDDGSSEEGTEEEPKKKKSTRSKMASTLSKTKKKAASKAKSFGFGKKKGAKSRGLEGSEDEYEAECVYLMHADERVPFVLNPDGSLEKGVVEAALAQPLLFLQDVGNGAVCGHHRPVPGRTYHVRSATLGPAPAHVTPFAERRSKAMADLRVSAANSAMAAGNQIEAAVARWGNLTTGSKIIHAKAYMDKLNEKGITTWDDINFAPDTLWEQVGLPLGLRNFLKKEASEHLNNH